MLHASRIHQKQKRQALDALDNEQGWGTQEFRQAEIAYRQALHADILAHVDRLERRVFTLHEIETVFAATAAACLRTRARVREMAHDDRVMISITKDEAHSRAEWADAKAAQERAEAVHALIVRRLEHVH